MEKTVQLYFKKILKWPRQRRSIPYICLLSSPFFFLTHKIEKILRQHEYETKQQQTITNKTRSYLREMQFGMS